MNLQMKVQGKVESDATDDQLRYLKQMNINHCFVMFRNEHSNYEDVNRLLDRIRKAGLTVTDAGNAALYKHPSIHLGLPDRDLWIDRYNSLNRILGEAGVPVGYMTWDAGRVLTSRWAVGEHTRSAVGRIVDMQEILARKPVFSREYDEAEILDNFTYWFKRTLPVCEETGIRIALHPNDPPWPKYEGCANLIYSAEGYKKAMEAVGGSPYLGIKFCCGCWLEGGKAFGDILENLRAFIGQKRVLSIHFRNVSATMPYFEETLLEDGYMDMYKVMKTLVTSGYDGAIYVDHVLRYDEQTGGEYASFAYSTGYMKGLMHAAMDETIKEK